MPCDRTTIANMFPFYKQDIIGILPYKNKHWRVIFNTTNPLIQYLKTHTTTTITIDSSIFWVVELQDDLLVEPDPLVKPRLVRSNDPLTIQVFSPTYSKKPLYTIPEVNKWPSVRTAEEREVDNANNWLRLLKHL